MSTSKGTFLILRKSFLRAVFQQVLPTAEFLSLNFLICILTHFLHILSPVLPAMIALSYFTKWESKFFMKLVFPQCKVKIICYAG